MRIRYLIDDTILNSPNLKIKIHTNLSIDVWSKNGLGEGFRLKNKLFDGFINPIIK